MFFGWLIGTALKFECCLLGGGLVVCLRIFTGCLADRRGWCPLWDVLSGVVVRVWGLLCFLGFGLDSCTYGVMDGFCSCYALFGLLDWLWLFYGVVCVGFDAYGF